MLVSSSEVFSQYPVPLLWEMQLMLSSTVHKNIGDPDQTAPNRSGSTLIATKTSFSNELVDDIWVVM